MHTLKYIRRGIKVGLMRLAEALAIGARDYYDGLTFTNSFPRVDFLKERRRA
jgi:hypothetical protein